MTNWMRAVCALCLGLLAACADDEAPDLNAQSPLDGGVFEIGDEVLELRPAANPERNAYFGDLHVHTHYSFDAFSFGTTATPYDAYRFARGEAIAHPSGFPMQLDRPLDFYAVTDHAMFLGVAQAAADLEAPFSRHAASEVMHGMNDPDNMGLPSLAQRMQAFARFLPGLGEGLRDGSIDPEETLEITRRAWLDTIRAADLHYVPGQFTTFVAYEYTTASAERGNLHRNVVFRGSDRLPEVPFSRAHSRNPEDLWNWMDGLRSDGIEALAIPHNSNGSDGEMFKFVDFAGEPIDSAYAEQRLRNEPLVEITQIKGTSETHPALSSEDEWADFELMEYRVATTLDSRPEGSYVRDALRRGLTMEQEGIFNPYRFGFVGASDTHTGAAQPDEDDYSSKLGILSRDAEMRGSVPLGAIQSFLFTRAAPDLVIDVEGETYIGGSTPTFGASGLAAVWAEENTREAIYDAFRRKETFATTGPRMRIRFFAGEGLEESMLTEPGGIARAYAAGVTMGGDLGPMETSPDFLVMAAADADGQQLQRLQMIKGWIDADGETHEAVIDIACAGGVAVDPDTQRCPDNHASVDLSDCSTRADTGASELATLWRDPNFDPAQRAFYYVRALENDTCRWTAWDALRAGVPPRPDLAATLQERAWSSPIHYLPGA